MRSAWWFVSSAAGVLASLAVADPVLYVDASATAGGDGAGWATAFSDLQDALDLVNAGSAATEIRIAEGIYLPDRGTGERVDSFAISAQNGVALIGGYPTGGGATRDPVANRTVLSGDLAGDDSVTFESGGGPVFVGTDENSETVLIVEDVNATVTIDGLVVTGGNSPGSGGGLHANNATLVLRGVTFRGNRAAADGGGAAVVGNASSLEMDGCVFELCRAGSRGGGFYVNTHTVQVAGSEFRRSAAAVGGGLWGETGSVAPRLVSGCLFAENTAADSGGGASLDGFLGVVESVFEENTANEGGGLFYGSRSTGPEGCTFRKNAATEHGGAVLLTGNETFTNCAFIENTAGARGGAVRFFNSNPRFVACRFERNAARNGGAISDIGLSGELAVETCVFIGNNASRNGGAIGFVNDLLANATLEAVSTLFVGNSAGREGGAIFAVEGVLTDTTVAFNESPQTGGLWSRKPIEIRRSIFWGNSTETLSREEAQLSGPLAVSSTIIEGLSETGPFNGGGNSGADPLFLDSLGPDGVPMSGDEDCNLSTGSPAIDAGALANDTGLATEDAAGLPRFVGLSGGPRFSDLGALEAQDCDRDGITDAEVIALGLADDCDGDGVIDGCTLGSLRDPVITRLARPEGSIQRTGFASDLAIDGARMIVLAPEYNDGEGTAYVLAPYSRSDAGWVAEPLVQGPVINGSRTYPRQVEITGDLAVVGLQVESQTSGPLAFFRIDPVTDAWAYDPALSERLFTLQDDLLWSIDADAQTIVCGTPRFDDLRGGAFYIERDGSGEWQPSRSFPAPPSERFDVFGEDIAVSGDLVVVGAPGVDSNGINGVGAAYVFRREAGNWVYEQRIDSPPLPGQLNQFGTGVACDGDRIAVSAPRNAGGVVFLFERGDQTWELVDELRPSGLSSNALFGRELVMENGTLISTAPGDDRAFVYRNAAEGWDIEAVLESGMPSSNQTYGASVAIGGSVALIGETIFFGAGAPSAWIYEPQVPDLDGNGRPDSCDDACPVDIAEPFGTLDLADIVAFIVAFGDGDPQADLAAPFGVLDLADIVAFIAAFQSGCP